MLAATRLSRHTSGQEKTHTSQNSDRCGAHFLIHPFNPLSSTMKLIIAIPYRYCYQGFKFFSIHSAY
ncbi:protein of unknown function [Shewanella benthica]|uniref:Uncharacterized protein n=1 Tax=Shewanella benthica TaxID=43661 RepID=A0A330M6X5_9GAMM|nr:protein of unknown function [Shewanella benthica]